MPVLISQAGGRGLKGTSQICVHLCFLRVGVLSTLDMLMDGLKHLFESQTKTVFDLHEKKSFEYLLTVLFGLVLGCPKCNNFFLKKQSFSLSEVT